MENVQKGQAHVVRRQGNQHRFMGLHLPCPDFAPECYLESLEMLKHLIGSEEAKATTRFTHYVLTCAVARVAL